MKSIKAHIIYRIIDANINRVKEGLRVCEEYTRFILEDRSLTTRLKIARHKLEASIKSLKINRYDLLAKRDSLRDIGKEILALELDRKDAKDIFLANIQRVKESIRVLEEFSKVINKKATLGFKDIRYTVYDIEKKAYSRLKKI